MTEEGLELLVALVAVALATEVPPSNEDPRAGKSSLAMVKLFPCVPVMASRYIADAALLLAFPPTGAVGLLPTEAVLLLEVAAVPPRSEAACCCCAKSCCCRKACASPLLFPAPPATPPPRDGKSDKSKEVAPPEPLALDDVEAADVIFPKPFPKPPPNPPAKTSACGLLLLVVDVLLVELLLPNMMQGYGFFTMKRRIKQSTPENNHKEPPNALLPYSNWIRCGSKLTDFLRQD